MNFIFATVPEESGCACGCHGRHTIDSMLGIFDWRMTIMLGGVRPLTKHDLQPVYAHKFLLVGRPLFF